MLQMLINYLIATIGESLELVVNLFMSWLDMDVTKYTTYFPVIGTAYTIFRGLGLGLVAVFAALSMIQFYQPAILGGREPDDTPAGILLKTMFAAGLVFGGNYILEWIIDIAKIPFDKFLGIESVAEDTIPFGDWMEKMLTNTAGELVDPGLAFGSGFLQLILICMIAWNLFKLMIEVCERYMMVGVLLFTSPPFFAMFASKDTMLSFKNWIKMFISACAMMSVSVFFLKLILSGFSVLSGGTETGAAVLGKLLLILATCKIAQRADSYLGQIGLGTATTGGNLLDDMLAVGRTMGALGGAAGGAKGGSRTSVLGKTASAIQFGGGLSGRMVNAIRAGKSAVENGADMDSLKAKIQNARDSYQPAGRAAQKSVGKAAAAGVKKVTGVDVSGAAKKAVSAAANTKAGQAVANGAKKVSQTAKQGAEKVANSGAFQNLGNAAINTYAAINPGVGEKRAAAQYDREIEAQLNNMNSKHEQEQANMEAAKDAKLADIRDQRAALTEERDVKLDEAKQQKADLALARDAAVADAERKDMIDLDTAKNQNAAEKVDAKYAGPAFDEMPKEMKDKIDKNPAAVSDYIAKQNYNKYGVGESGITMDRNAELSVTAQARGAGVSLDTEKGILTGNTKAVSDIVAKNYSGAVIEPSDGTRSFARVVGNADDMAKTTADYSKDTEKVLADTVAKGPAAVAEGVLQNPNFVADGTQNFNPIGSAAVAKIIPETAAQAKDGKFTHVQAQNLPNMVNENGQEVRGGRQWSAEYVGTNGQRHMVTGIDDAAYYGMQATGQSTDGFKQMHTKNGTALYTKDELIPERAPENAPAQPSANDAAAQMQMFTAMPGKEKLAKDYSDLHGLETYTNESGSGWSVRGVDADGNRVKIEGIDRKQYNSLPSEEKRTYQLNKNTSGEYMRVTADTAAQMEKAVPSSSFDSNRSGRVAESDGKDATPIYTTLPETGAKSSRVQAVQREYSQKIGAIDTQKIKADYDKQINATYTAEQKVKDDYKRADGALRNLQSDEANAFVHDRADNAPAGADSGNARNYHTVAKATGSNLSGNMGSRDGVPTHDYSQGEPVKQDNGTSPVYGTGRTVDSPVLNGSSGEVKESRQAAMSAEPGKATSEPIRVEASGGEHRMPEAKAAAPRMETPEQSVSAKAAMSAEPSGAAPEPVRVETSGGEHRMPEAKASAPRMETPEQNISAKAAMSAEPSGAAPEPARVDTSDGEHRMPEVNANAPRMETSEQSVSAKAAMSAEPSGAAPEPARVETSGGEHRMPEAKASAPRMETPEQGTSAKTAQPVESNGTISASEHVETNRSEYQTSEGSASGGNSQSAERIAHTNTDGSFAVGERADLNTAAEHIHTAGEQVHVDRPADMPSKRSDDVEKDASVTESNVPRQEAETYIPNVKAHVNTEGSFAVGERADLDTAAEHIRTAEEQIHVDRPADMPSERYDKAEKSAPVAESDESRQDAETYIPNVKAHANTDGSFAVGGRADQNAAAEHIHDVGERMHSEKSAEASSVHSAETDTYQPATDAHRVTDAPIYSNGQTVNNPGTAVERDAPAVHQRMDQRTPHVPDANADAKQYTRPVQSDPYSAQAPAYPTTDNGYVEYPAAPDYRNVGQNIDAPNLDTIRSEAERSIESIAQDAARASALASMIARNSIVRDYTDLQGFESYSNDTGSGWSLHGRDRNGESVVIEGIDRKQYDNLPEEQQRAYTHSAETAETGGMEFFRVRRAQSARNASDTGHSEDKEVRETGNNASEKSSERGADRRVVEDVQDTEVIDTSDTSGSIGKRRKTVITVDEDIKSRASESHARHVTDTASFVGKKGSERPAPNIPAKPSSSRSGNSGNKSGNVNRTSPKPKNPGSAPPMGKKK